MTCIQCDKPVSREAFFCSVECQNKWEELQAEAEREYIHDLEESFEDREAGCWSQSW